MRRILKRFLRQDQFGNVLHDHVEITAEKDNDIGVFSVESFPTCPSCSRPVKPDDSRGRCGICGLGTCICQVPCAACSRPLCSNCRRGFVAVRVRATVCPICLPKLERAAALVHSLEMQRQKIQLLQSSLLDRLPGVGIVRQLEEIKLLKQLESLDEEMPK